MYAGDPKNNNIKDYEGNNKSVYEDDDILKYDNNGHIFAMDYVSSKAGDSSLNSLDNTLQFQKMEVQKKIEEKHDNEAISRVIKIS